MAINEGAFLLIAVYFLKVDSNFLIMYFAFLLIITSLTLLSKV